MIPFQVNATTVKLGQRRRGIDSTHRAIPKYGYNQQMMSGFHYKAVCRAALDVSVQLSNLPCVLHHWALREGGGHLHVLHRYTYGYTLFKTITASVEFWVNVL